MSDIPPDLARQVLDLELDGYHGQPTVRAFLLALLRKVWAEEEDFDGKRPFGNSGWRRDLYAPIEAAGLVDGGPDEDAAIARRQADDLVNAAVDALGQPETDYRALLVRAVRELAEEAGDDSRCRLCEAQLNQDGSCSLSCAGVGDAL